MSEKTRAFCLGLASVLAGIVLYVFLCQAWWLYGPLDSQEEDLPATETVVRPGMATSTSARVAWAQEQE